MIETGVSNPRCCRWTVSHESPLDKPITAIFGTVTDTTGQSVLHFHVAAARMTISGDLVMSQWAGGPAIMVRLSVYSRCLLIGVLALPTWQFQRPSCSPPFERCNPAAANCCCTRLLPLQPSSCTAPAESPTVLRCCQQKRATESEIRPSMSDPTSGSVCGCGCSSREEPAAPSAPSRRPVNDPVQATMVAPETVAHDPTPLHRWTGLSHSARYEFLTANGRQALLGCWRN